MSDGVSTKNVDKMTPAQCRAARGLLEITQSQLAHAADLGLSTVVDFEKERRQVSLEAVEAIRAALERAGVEFIDENGGGEGLRRRKPRHPRRK
jgi:transcriptional regulator with XRE-family HTH domain